VTAARDWPGTVVALLFAGLGGYAVSGSLGMTPLGAIFPRTIGLVLVGLAAVQAARCFTGRGGASELEEGETGGSVWRRAGVGAVMLAWALLFPVIGFIVTGFLAVVALGFIAEFDPPTPRQLGIRLGIAAAMVGLFYWLMVAVLYIPMPQAWLI
jgi:putative tricarboxylic transport membrane protein